MHPRSDISPYEWMFVGAALWTCAVVVLWSFVEMIKSAIDRRKRRGN